MTAKRRDTVQKVPADTNAERAVIDCLVRYNKEFDKVSDLEPADFSEPKHRLIFGAIRDLHTAGKPFDLLSLCSYMRTKHTGRDYAVDISEIVDGTAVIPSLSNYAETLKGHTARRAYLSEGEHLISIAQNGHGRDLDTELPGVIDRLNQISARSDLDLSDCLVTPDTLPTITKPVAALQGVSFAFPAGLVVFAGQKKHGKTAGIEAIIAAAVCNNDPEREQFLLGFECFNPDKKAVLYFDTERTPLDTHYMRARILKRADEVEMPHWVKLYNIRHKTVLERNKLIKQAIRAAADETGGVLSVMIDGYSDLVNNINGITECSDRVIELMTTSTEYSTAIMGALHYNPISKQNGDFTKARGHLGTLLGNKCDSEVSFCKDNDLTVTAYINPDSARNEPLPKDRGSRFAWDMEHGMFTMKETLAAERTAKKVSDSKTLFEQVFRDVPDGLTHTELIEGIIRVQKDVNPTCSESTAKRRRSEAEGFRIIEHRKNKRYYLNNNGY